MTLRSKAKRTLFYEQRSSPRPELFSFVTAMMIHYKYNFQKIVIVRTRWPRGQRRWHVSKHCVVAPHCNVAWDLVVRITNNYAAYDNGV